MDMPAEFYLQTVDEVFQRATLALGTMTWRGRPRRPGGDPHDRAADRRRRTATTSRRPVRRYAAHALCSGIPAERHEHYVQPGVGHYGIFSGRHGATEIEPRIAAFIAAHRRRNRPSRRGGTGWAREPWPAAA